MNLLRRQLEITGEDHPATVYAALLGSIAVYNREMPEGVSWAWVKKAQDAYEAVQAGFGIVDTDSEPMIPAGKALLFHNLDQLEYALVGHGVHAIEEFKAEEVENVETLLRSIDSLRT